MCCHGFLTFREAVLRAAKYNLERALDEGSVDEVVMVLEKVRDHIQLTADPRSTAMLLPDVLMLLDAPGAYARLLGAEPLSREPLLEQRAARAIVGSTDPHESSAPGRWTKWLGGLSDSFLRQESVVCVDFLLVLSVLSFNVVLSAFLSRFHVEIKSYIEPILHVTDVCLVSIFCFESLTLLIMTASKEILRKGHGSGRVPMGALTRSSGHLSWITLHCIHFGRQMRSRLSF